MENILVVNHDAKLELPECFGEFLFPELACAGEKEIRMDLVEKYFPNFVPNGTRRQKDDVLWKLRKDGLLEFSLGLQERDAIFEKGVEFFLRFFRKDDTVYFWKSIFGDKKRVSERSRWSFYLDQWKDTWYQPQPLIFVPILFIPGCKESLDEPDRLVKGYHCLNGDGYKYDHYHWGVVSPLYKSEK